MGRHSKYAERPAVPFRHIVVFDAGKLKHYIVCVGHNSIIYPDRCLRQRQRGARLQLRLTRSDYLRYHARQRVRIRQTSVSHPMAEDVSAWMRVAPLYRKERAFARK